MQHLQPNSTLQGGRYRIIDTLGQGGFGITYLAIQSGLERKVAVKEFFMKELCERDESTSHVTLGTEGSRETVSRFREKFLKEARNIARLNHPNIVRIIDVFEENGTAYYVMEYAENGSLAEKVKREGYLSEPVATRYILQVAEALDYVHQQKMNHLDVKPANIMLNEKDESVLIDFGLSKQYDATTGSQTSTTPVGISEGYAPMEQYKQGGVGEFSPETDIYALGATFFKLLTGITPPSASDVNEDGVPVKELKPKGISDTAISVICKAMESRKRDRMKSVHEFMDSLKGQAVESVQPQVDDEATLLTPDNQQKEEERKRKEAETKRIADGKAAAERNEKAAKRISHEEENWIAESAPQKEKSNKGWIGIVATLTIIVGIVFAIIYSNSAVETYIVNGISFDMVKVEGGTFTMGGDQCDSLSRPTRTVTLSSYYIGKTEVTQALWKAVMGNNPSLFKGDNLPVNSVSWNDCQDFIQKLNSLTGKKFRLPKEAEWEFAARGGNMSKHYQYSGGNNIDDVAWYWKNSGDKYSNRNEDDLSYDNFENVIKGNNCKTHPVASKQPNELGIYDMTGNVCEICSDYSNWTLTELSDASRMGICTLCGGSWRSRSFDCRLWYPDAIGIEGHNPSVGLRLVLSK